MKFHIERGKYGETEATEYLRHRGFQILFRNWRFKRYEIDIIAEKNNVVHFVEVKTRSSLKFGYPEGSVTKKKFRCLQNAAAAYQNLHPQVKNIQFDVLSILVQKGKEIEFFFIEDVFLG